MPTLNLDVRTLTQAGGGMSLAMEEKILNIENNVIDIKEVMILQTFVFTLLPTRTRAFEDVQRINIDGANGACLNPCVRVCRHWKIPRTHTHAHVNRAHTHTQTTLSLTLFHEQKMTKLLAKIDSMGTMGMYSSGPAGDSAASRLPGATQVFT